jgi:DNA-directed RNA polymerase delta subunit
LPYNFKKYKIKRKKKPMERYKIEKIFIPSENSPTTTVVLKFVQDLETGKVYVGVGEDEWVSKNGMSMDDINKFKNGA